MNFQMCTCQPMRCDLPEDTIPKQTERKVGEYLHSKRNWSLLTRIKSFYPKRPNYRAPVRYCNSAFVHVKNEQNQEH